MSNLLQLQDGAKSYGTKTLFDAAQFAVNEGEHVGVIGPNGAGKTTLFKILSGQEMLDDGVIVKSKTLQMGYLAQHDNWQGEQTVEDYLSHQSKTPLWRLKALGRGLGISDDLYQKPVTSLSGGFRMRCKLLSLIGQEPNLMLLDEPTNYLDLETTLVLEKFLQGYEGAFLLISHDREFLRRTTDHILEIEQGDVTKYNGNLDDYFEQKELLRTQLETRALSLQEKKDEVLKFVARFGAKATKAKQAQSRLKSLDKMETIELKSLPVKAMIRIPQPVKTGKIVLAVKNADLGYGAKIILKNINYVLQNGDHVAIVGLNGAGKTTFLKALAGALPPLRGDIEPGLNVSIGYYAQHVADSIADNSTVLDQMMINAHPDIKRQDALDMAGSLLFSGTDVTKKTSVLSGGERARVALGRILLQRAPCLVLDEPTNHLDFQTVEALTQALTNYQGTIVVVSHDRSFIRRVGRKVIEINHGEASLYPGTYDDYVWSLQNGVLSQRERTQSKDRGEAPRKATSENISKPGQESFTGNRVSEGLHAKVNYKETKKTLERDLRKCEKTLTETDQKLTELNQRLLSLNQVLAGPQSSDQGPRPQSEIIAEIVEIQAKITRLEEEWFATVEKKEICEVSLKNLTDKSDS